MLFWGSKFSLIRILRTKNQVSDIDSKHKDLNSQISDPEKLARHYGFVDLCYLFVSTEIFPNKNPNRIDDLNKLLNPENENKLQRYQTLLGEGKFTKYKLEYILLNSPELRKALLKNLKSEFTISYNEFKDNWLKD